MGLVIVDFRCTSYTASGCFSIGLEILRQTFTSDFMPVQMVIITDDDGLTVLMRLNAIEDGHTVSINGKSVPIVTTKYLEDRLLSSGTDTYFRLGACGVMPKHKPFKPIPEFKHGVPKIVILSMQSTFSSQASLAAHYNAYYPWPACIVMLGFGSDRIGLISVPGIVDEARVITPPTAPFRLMYLNPYERSNDGNCCRVASNFISFSQWPKPLLMRFVHVGALTTIQDILVFHSQLHDCNLQLCDVSNVDHPIWSEISKGKWQACEDPADKMITVYHYESLPSQSMKQFIQQSDKYILTGGLATFYEAMRYHKIVFNQCVSNNISAYRDMAGILQIRIDDYPESTFSNDELFVVMRYFFSPIVNRQKMGAVQDIIGKHPALLDAIADLYFEFYSDYAGKVGESLQRYAFTHI